MSALHCPVCHERLGSTGSALDCGSCGGSYPAFSGIPCLVPDVGLFRARWLAEIGAFSERVDRRLHALREEMQIEGVLPRVQQRIEGVIAALVRQRSALLERLSVLRGDERWLPSSAIPVNRTADSGAAALHHYENIFRDWAWGDRENRAALDLVTRLAPETVTGLAVYGAGAGRLAVDVHRALTPTQTFALDLNPFPLFVAAELVRGNEVALDEFPVAPHSGDATVIVHQLRCETEVPDGLVFLLADALRPPFLPGSLDAVLTPWFIDAVDCDFRATAVALNRALSLSGTWINTGPLRFRAGLSQGFMIEEVHEIVEQSGFEITSTLREDVPYFASPHSGFRREETVFGFSAKKRAEATASPVASSEPSWVLDPSLPIQMTGELEMQRRSSLFTLSILALIDGKRSIRDVAAQLAQQWKTDPETLAEQLRAYFARM